MEPLSKSDQILVAGVAVAVCLLVLLSLRGTRPGAPARMGAIVAGIVMLLALMVGLRAHDLTNPRSDDRETPVALRPKAAQPFGGAVISGDPQTGLSIRPPTTVQPPTSAQAPTNAQAPKSAQAPTSSQAPSDQGPSDQALTSDQAPTNDQTLTSSQAPTSDQPATTTGTNPAATYPAGAYLPDARYCDGRLDTHVRIDAVNGRQGSTESLPDTANAVSVIEAEPSGLVLGIRAGSDPAVPPALSILYTPADQQARLVTADGTTVGSLTSAAAEPSIRVDLHDSSAEVWFDGQKLTDRAVPVADGCGAVRFSAWGGSAALRNLVIRPAN